MLGPCHYGPYHPNGWIIIIKHVHIDHLAHDRKIPQVNFLPGKKNLRVCVALWLSELDDNGEDS